MSRYVLNVTNLIFSLNYDPIVIKQVQAGKQKDLHK